MLQNIRGLKPYFIIFLCCIFFNVPGYSQVADSTSALKDSIVKVQPPTITPLQKILKENKYLNSESESVSLAIKKRTPVQENTIFYILAGLMFFFGIIKTVYARYFSTLFRVFFNSSLRQSQLTDQLIQAKLPSLFFNIIFLVSAALYVYFLLQKLNYSSAAFNGIILLGCFLVFALIFLKFEEN